MSDIILNIIFYLEYKVLIISEIFIFYSCNMLSLSRYKLLLYASKHSEFCLNLENDDFTSLSGLSGLLIYSSYESHLNFLELVPK